MPVLQVYSNTGWVEVVRGFVWFCGRHGRERVRSVLGLRSCNIVLMLVFCVGEECLVRREPWRRARFFASHQQLAISDAGSECVQVRNGAAAVLLVVVEVCTSNEHYKHVVYILLVLY